MPSQPFEKRRTVLLCRSIEERHMGELGDTIALQEHVLFSLLQTELTAVDMQVADFGWSKLSILGPTRLSAGEPVDSMAHLAAMQGTASQLRQMSQQVVQGKQGAAPELNHYRFCSIRDAGRYAAWQAPWACQRSSSANATWPQS